MMTGSDINENKMFQRLFATTKTHVKSDVAFVDTERESLNLFGGVVRRHTVDRYRPVDEYFPKIICIPDPPCISLISPGWRAMYIYAGLYIYIYIYNSSVGS